MTNPDHIAITKDFDDNIIQNIGVPATETDFDKDYLTPTFEYYNNDNQDATPDAPPENLTPTPEIGDNYLNTELMLPRGGTLARGRVTERKRDHEGNVIGRSNANPTRGNMKIGRASCLPQSPVVAYLQTSVTYVNLNFMNGLCLMTHRPLSPRLSFRWDDG